MIEQIVYTKPVIIDGSNITLKYNGNDALTIAKQAKQHSLQMFFLR
jgi:hypothetical protein